jgi:hypothetical protein
MTKEEALTKYIEDLGPLIDKQDFKAGYDAGLKAENKYEKLLDDFFFNHELEMDQDDLWMYYKQLKEVNNDKT